MCLSKVTSHKYESYVAVEAYKIFLKNNLAYEGLWYRNGNYHIGEVYYSSHRPICADDVQTYCSGFHSFENLDDARGYLECLYEDGWRGLVICKVMLNTIFARGTQNGLKCIVSGEMRIIEEIK